MGNGEGGGLPPIQFASDLHGATAVCVCLLEAFLVRLVLRGGRVVGRFVHGAACVVVAAVGLLLPRRPRAVRRRRPRATSAAAHAGRRTAATAVAVAAAAVVAFLVTDTVFGPPAPRGLGAPVESVTIGRYTISLYGDDIGAAVGPSVAPG